MKEAIIWQKQKCASIRFIWGSCCIYVISIYLRTLDSNIISISENVRFSNMTEEQLSATHFFSWMGWGMFLNLSWVGWGMMFLNLSWVGWGMFLNLSWVGWGMLLNLSWVG